MPINKKAYRRYRVIDACIRNKMRPYPTMEELIEACREKLDVDVSSETIQKDIANMKLPSPDGLDAPIKFNRAKGGYMYTNPAYSISGISLNTDDISAIKESLDLLNDLGRERLSGKFKFAMEKVLASMKEEIPEDFANKKIIQTDIPSGARGYEHFELFYSATRDEIPVSFVHYSYQKRQFKSLTVHPFVIKEFQNRWYVIGFSELHHEIRTFGLDRIYAPFLTYESFRRVDTNHRLTYLNDVFGVFPLRDGEKEKIEIHADPIVAYYFQAYPIHQSQEIKMNDYGNAVISWELVPSLELAQLILSYGDQVQVVEPERLKQYIKKIK